MFRTSGNLNLNSTEVVHGQKFKVNITQKKNVLSFLQYLKPFTPDTPYFSVTIQNIKPEGNVTIGIAGLDLNESLSPGQYNNTIGYESSTGKCLSSHRVNANTNGRPVKCGDSFGLYVSYFGSSQSTIIFVHNNEPVATRYHFETDASCFLPTITFDNGSIEIDIFWPDAVDSTMLPPFLNENNNNKIKWVKPANEYCAEKTEADSYHFENLIKLEDMPIQAVFPLSKTFHQYDCTQLEVSNDGTGSPVGIASCSPLKPTPTCTLLRDYYTWLPKMKLKQGNTIGWGIFYNPETPNVKDMNEQLVLVYVTFNHSIVDVLFVLQPEGGFFPLVLMQPWSTKIKLELSKQKSGEEIAKLAKLFHAKLGPAVEIYNNDINQSAIIPNDIKKSNNDINICVEKTKTIIKIPSNKHGLHLIQYRKPLTPDRRFFFLEIVRINSNSNVVVGIAPSSFLDTDTNSKKIPGLIQDTIGYSSKSGLLFYNNKSHGNMMGHKCTKGDSMAIEMEVFEPEMSVAIFGKNFKPVGTRFLTLKDHQEFFPTIAINNSGGDQIELNVYWQTVVSMPPHFNVRNPEDWCLPEGTKIDPKDKTFLLPNHYDHSLCLQAPYSLHHKYNHFEIILIDDFDKNNPPPALALCTACPFDPPPTSQFKQDYLRFWPTGEAMSAVKKNDRIGWGIFYADEDAPQDEEQLMICFLTINRQVVYLRVLFQPPGGFYPVIIAPPNVNRVKMDFMATRVSTEDFAGDQIKSIILDANKQIEVEKKLIAQAETKET